MTFRIAGLDPTQFRQLFGLSDSALAALGAERHVVTEKPGAPCRVTLADAELGETVLLLSYRHQGAETPYRQAGPIFVRERADAAFDAIDLIPPALFVRTLSVRAYNARGAMLDADLVEGADLPDLIGRFWDNPDVAYAHAHNARRGCFAAAIYRA